MATQFSTSAPYVLTPGAGRSVSWLSAPVVLKASSRDLGVTEIAIGPGDEPPLHVHKNEDEWFYVLEGEVTFHAGGESQLGKAGAFVFFPRGIPHTFTVESPAARFLLVNTPGGFERMFELAPKTEEDAVRALNAYGVEVVGPHPRRVG
jgi:quercetin dioxygenase-like cupin family protein